MLLLRILSGKTAGQEILASRFPFTIGRQKDADLTTAEAGVWEKHLVLELDRDTGFKIRAGSEASILVNGEPVTSAHLKMGDKIGLGAFEFACWLQPPKQVSLVGRELFVWGLIGLVMIAQAALVSWLLIR